MSLFGNLLGKLGSFKSKKKEIDSSDKVIEGDNNIIYYNNINNYQVHVELSPKEMDEYKESKYLRDSEFDINEVVKKVRSNEKI